MKKKWIPMFLAIGLFVATPLSFQLVEATSHASVAEEDKLPARLENLMDIESVKFKVM